MMAQNPLRREFYEHYQKIIEEYNEGKDQKAVEKAFDDLWKLMKEVSKEEARAMAEGLDEETLAIFDLLRKPKLSKSQEKEVKKVAKETLATLKAEKLKIRGWRESAEITAKIRAIISDCLQWLPPERYDDDEIVDCTEQLYEYIHSTC